MGDFRFTLPMLPKPDYRALRQLADQFGCSQLEIVCVGIRLACEDVHNNGLNVRRVLAEFRTTAPSQQPPLLPLP